MKYNIGDEVVLKVNIHTESSPRYEKKKVQIIGIEVLSFNEQYLCYVPQWISMKNTFKLNVKHQKHYYFDDKFLNEQGCFITDETDAYETIKAQEGEICTKCYNFVRWAEYDIDNKFLCRSCVLNPYR